MLAYWCLETPCLRAMQPDAVLEWMVKTLSKAERWMKLGIDYNDVGLRVGG